MGAARSRSWPRLRLHASSHLRGRLRTLVMHLLCHLDHFLQVQEVGEFRGSFEDYIQRHAAQPETLLLEAEAELHPEEEVGASFNVGCYGSKLSKLSAEKQHACSDRSCKIELRQRSQSSPGWSWCT